MAGRVSSKTLTHDVIFSSIAPPKYTGLSPDYVSHNQLMNTFSSCILLLKKPQNMSSSTGRFYLILLIIVFIIGNFLPRLFLSFCLIIVSKYASILLASLERSIYLYRENERGREREYNFSCHFHVEDLADFFPSYTKFPNNSWFLLQCFHPEASCLVEWLTCSSIMETLKIR